MTIGTATHCPQNHEYTKENTCEKKYTNADGTIKSSRQCKTCKRTQGIYRKRDATKAARKRLRLGPRRGIK